MNTIHFLSEPALLALGWTLLHALWQGFALVLPVAVVLHLLQHRSSHIRYVLGVGTLLAQVVLSIGTFIWYYQPLSQASLATAVPRLQTLLLQTAYYTPRTALPWYMQLQQFLTAHLTEIVICWAIGVCVFLIRLVGGWLYIQRLKTTALAPVTTVWAAPLAKLRANLALSAAVQVRESARVAMPLVIGAIKPVLLLPIGLATSLSLRELEAVLAHELAHIKRHDYAVNLLQSVVEVVYFFHPALWWLSARVREERENCCDDLAVLACGDARALAEALARVEEFSQAQPVLAMAFASKQAQLLNRIRRMLGVTGGPVVSNAHLALLTLATVLLLSVSVYAVQKQDSPTKKHRLPKIAQPNRHASPGVFPAAVIVSDNGQSQATVEVADAAEMPDAPAQMADYVIAADTTITPDANVNINGTATTTNRQLQRLLTKTDAANRERQRDYHQRQMDSLSQLIAQRQPQLDELRLQMENMRFKTEELERKMEVLNWRKDKLSNQRMAQIEKRQSFLYQNDNDKKKPKLSQADIEKQLADSEQQIKTAEQGITDVNKEIEALRGQRKTAQQPLEALEKQADQLENQVNKLAEQIGEHGDAYGEAIPELTELDDLEVTVSPERRTRTIRGVRAPRAIRVTPGAAVTIPSPPAAPVARPVSTPKPATVSRPAAPPKPAIAPKAPKD